MNRCGAKGSGDAGTWHGRCLHDTVKSSQGSATGEPEGVLLRNQKTLSETPAGRRPGDGSDRSHDGTLIDLPLTDEQKRSVSVLVVDDEETILESAVNVLQHDGYEVKSVSRGSAAEHLLGDGNVDIALIDLFMSGVSGAELLRTALAARPDVIVVMITGRPSVESSIQVLRDGAWDYLPKPFSAPQLRILVGRAAHTVIVSREARALKDGGTRADEPVLLGESPVFHDVVALARKVAATDASVFITGESGTGKEMVAQFIHHMSRRKSRELVAVNCAALPEPLLESEMFGHVKGAFTGATRDKSGLMETANGGTLFLDELIELSPMTQAKLLRVVQDGVVRRVGSSRTDAVVNVRFIAATNYDPAMAISEGRLREDLYYRLAVVPIHVPPLRERPDDIPLLARHFLQQYWPRHRGTARPTPKLSDEAIRQLQQRPWKGNVRELQNVIEHAIVVAEGRDVIEVEDLHVVGEVGADRTGSRDASLAPGSPIRAYHETRERVMARFERDYLTQVLQETQGNVSEAARVAGVNRATLYRILERHGLTKGDVLE
jgi:DNA-binding NtrC family response regulator